MLDVRLLREERDRLSEGLAKRGEPVDVDRLVRLDEEYRRLLAESERLKAERNARSKEIEMMRTGQKDRGRGAQVPHARGRRSDQGARRAGERAQDTSTRCSSRFRTCRIPRCPRGAPKESARPRVGRIAELSTSSPGPTGTSAQRRWGSSTSRGHRRSRARLRRADRRGALPRALIAFMLDHHRANGYRR